ncbi:MAG: hypothetical protein V6Z78_04935 [Holosporaceae bacterium]
MASARSPDFKQTRFFSPKPLCLRSFSKQIMRPEAPTKVERVVSEKILKEYEVDADIVLWTSTIVKD